MEELVNKLTENGKYANEICLMCLVDNNEYMLKYFEKYDIIGRKLEIFAKDCCNEYDTNIMREVLLCMDWELFDVKLVHQNLESSNPIPFIEEYMIPGEGWIKRYQRYRDTFKNNMQKRNKSR